MNSSRRFRVVVSTAALVVLLSAAVCPTVLADDAPKSDEDLVAYLVKHPSAEGIRTTLDRARDEGMDGVRALSRASAADVAVRRVMLEWIPDASRQDVEHATPYLLWLEMNSDEWRRVRASLPRNERLLMCLRKSPDVLVSLSLFSVVCRRIAELCSEPDEAARCIAICAAAAAGGDRQLPVVERLLDVVFECVAQGQADEFLLEYSVRAKGESGWYLGMRFSKGRLISRDTTLQIARVNGEAGLQLALALMDAKMLTDPRLRAEALRASESVDIRTRLAAVERLGLSSDSGVVQRLLLMTRDPVAAVRAEALRALGNDRVRSEEFRSLLARAVSDADVQVRLAAVDVLGGFEGSLSTRELLVGALDDVEPLVREAALDATLRWWPDEPSAARRILKDLQDPTGTVAEAVAKGLSLLESANRVRVGSTIVATLSVGESTAAERVAGLYALRALGVHDPSWKGVFERELSSSDTSIRRIAEVVVR